MIQPSYIRLYEEGILHERLNAVRNLMDECRICPRKCLVNRNAGEKGICRTGSKAVVSSYGAHFGEEAPLVGRSGSGTIFFTHCNLNCLFCQNYDISQLGEGREVDSGVLSALMLDLAAAGCHNINFVTPTHVIGPILEALIPAVEAGLNIPLVYNSGGYDSMEAIRLLDGVFDIYMPDFKFWDNEAAGLYCGAPDYRDRACEAVREMHRQVGDLELDKSGVAIKGLLVRHLVMPEGAAGTENIASFLADLSPATYINIMGQYRPCGRAGDFPKLSRPVSSSEVNEARNAALQAGLNRLDERGGFLFRGR